MSKFSFVLPPRGNYPSRKEWQEACWKKILKSERILELLVTSYERDNLVKRAAIIDGLNSGKKSRQISRELGLSLQTISVIRKALKESGYKSYRERGKTERKKKVYSSNSSQKKKKPYRRYRKTKYGKVYLP